MSPATVDIAVTANAPPRWRADLALAFVALVWGCTFVVVKSALSEISTVYFLALRFAIASFCMAALFIPSFRREGTRAVLRGLRGGALAGICLWSGYMLQTYGLKYTSAGKSGFITGLYIVLVPILGAMIYRRIPQLSEIIGILAATAGLVLLTIPNLELRVNTGDLLTLACAVAFAFHLLVLGYYSQREQFESVALGQILCAAILSGLALWGEPPRAVWSANVIFALVLTSVFATALAFALQTWAQKYTSATRTALIFALEPVFALVTAIGVGGESITIPGLIGAALILGGILLVELKPFVRA
ncbi:MAG TPA: DMT family transporter [Bryobacteraceae bacterium]|nr:DMT family transporter [Bryobacteraceae bacterium]